MIQAEKLYLKLLENNLFVIVNSEGNIIGHQGGVKIEQKPSDSGTFITVNVELYVELWKE